MTELKLATVNDEKRILDTDLAERLGMSRARDIRKDLIKPNREELEAHGILREVSANTGMRGRCSIISMRQRSGLL